MGARNLVFAGAGIVGAATAATSSVTLFELGLLCKIGATWSPLAAALPIALDAGAAVGALAWITERGPVRAWGRGIAVGALVGSLAGNALQHAIAAGLLAVTLPVVLAVGASIPAMLWATMHLAALMRAPAPKAAARPKVGRKLGATPVPATRTATRTTPVAAAPTVLAGHRGNRAAMVSWASTQPQLPSLRSIQERWHCSLATAKRVRAGAKAAS